MSQAIIDIKHLKKSYGQNEVLKDISLSVKKGEVISIIGSSGSGKSTTGKAIIGLEKITSGSVIYEGENVTNQRRKRNSAFNRDIQMIFQDSTSAMNPRKRVQDILAASWLMQ